MKSRLIFRKFLGYSGCLHEKYCILSPRSCKWWTRSNDSPQANLSRRNAHVLYSLPKRSLSNEARRVVAGRHLAASTPSQHLIWCLDHTHVGGANCANISCAANVESFLAASSHCICAQSIFSTLAGIREHPGVFFFSLSFLSNFWGTRPTSHVGKLWQ